MVEVNDALPDTPSHEQILTVRVFLQEIRYTQKTGKHIYCTGRIFTSKTINWVHRCVCGVIVRVRNLGTE